MANNSINLVNLDFDTLKDSLKTYLRGQSKFSDYDFDGSNMSVLLDLLTYNTHLNAFYLNMVTSEMFLDSAQLRNSVISIAKALNYTPRSTKSSRAVLNLRFPQSGLQSFSIPERTRFVGKNSRGTFQFLTDESMVLYPANGSFIASNLSIYEGITSTDAFAVNYSVENQRFILTNDTIDTDSLRVSVSENNGQTVFQTTKATTLFGLNANSAVYFLQATEDTRYEIVFGDGVLGRRPKDGSIIQCTYRTSSGADGNECTNFVLADNLGAFNGLGSAVVPTITTVNPSFGGGEAESIEEIRTRAPRYYQAQERAVTTSDFETLITQEFQFIKGVHVYGGDQRNGTPSFGQIFIAPITFTGEAVSQTQKNEIETFMKNKCTIGITPTVVDPDYLYVGVDAVVSFIGAQTVLSAADIQAAVETAIETYNTEQLINFNTEFKTSRFEAAIDAADPSISSNDTDIILRKRFNAEPFVRTFPNVTYRNQIVPGTVTSSSFLSGGRKFEYTDFNPNNNTFSVNQVDGKASVTNSSNVMYLKDVTSPATISYSIAGTVDYTTGALSLNAITPTSLNGIRGIDFFARPVFENVASTTNDVIAVDLENITVTVKQI